MSHLAASAVLLVLLAAPSWAQQKTYPGTITAPADEAGPLIVQAVNPDGGAINGLNSEGAFTQTAAGVLGRGVTGVHGEGRQIGGWFTSVSNTGLAADGWLFGALVSCRRVGCIAVRGEAPGSGVVGIGAVGIVGVAGPPTQFVPIPLAGAFAGSVHITESLSVTGSISSPTVDQLTAQIASLTARLTALEGSRTAPATIHIEAEDYTAFVDSTPGNLGGAYRSDDVDIKPSAEGGFAVGWMTAGEWLSYTVNVPVAGVYHVSSRVGSIFAGRTFMVGVDGRTSAALAVPQMPAWDQYGMVDAPAVTLSAGPHTIRVVVGSQDYIDMQYLELRP